MDPIQNPYTPNAGSRPPELAGRGAQIKQFEILVGRLKVGATDQSMVLRGLRGVGKTALLNTFEDMAESAGFLTYYHELTQGSSLIQEIARDAESALGRFRPTKRLAANVRDALSHLRTIRLVGPEGFEIAIDLSRGDEGIISGELAELFLQLGKAAQAKGSGVVFLIDEVQFAEPLHYRALITALHRATQKNMPITVAAAGLPQIPQLAGEARSYAERLFDFPVLDKLEETATIAAIVQPAHRRKVEYAADAITRALEWTEGYPFYIQQLGKHAWNLADVSPITKDDVEAAIPAAQQVLDRSIYEVRIQRATEAERRYMRGMADLGQGPYRSSGVAKRLGKATSTLSPIRQRLIDKGLIYATEDYGFIDFTVPRFDDFMRRRIDL
jgi:AAA ATPase-like protein